MGPYGYLLYSWQKFGSLILCRCLQVLCSCLEEQCPAWVSPSQGTLPRLLAFTFFLPSTFWCSLCFRRGQRVISLKSKCLALHQLRDTEIKLELSHRSLAYWLVSTELWRSMQAAEKIQLWSHSAVDHACYNTKLHCKIIPVVQLVCKQQLPSDGSWDLFPGRNTHLVL